MSCRYKNKCPSYTGWCEDPKQDFSKCVPFLITAYENKCIEKAEGCTPLTIYIPDIFIETGNIEQLKEFLYGVIADAIYNRQVELGIDPRSEKIAF